MCLAVYIASSSELPTSQWSKADPKFYLEIVPPREGVRKQFSLQHIYYVGSHEGCGCGFLKDGEQGPESEACQANYHALAQAQCLRTAIAGGAQLQLFSCWEGDQTTTPEHVATATPNEIADPLFKLQEKQLINVREDV